MLTQCHVLQMRIALRSNFALGVCALLCISLDIGDAFFYIVMQHHEVPQHIFVLSIGHSLKCVVGNVYSKAKVGLTVPLTTHTYYKYSNGETRTRLLDLGALLAGELFLDDPMPVYRYHVAVYARHYIYAQLRGRGKSCKNFQIISWASTGKRNALQFDSVCKLALLRVCTCIQNEKLKTFFARTHIQLCELFRGQARACIFLIHYN